MASTDQARSESLMCANNCGFFGSAATRNLCSKCYKDALLQDSPKEAVEKSLKSNSTNIDSAFSALSISSNLTTDSATADVDSSLVKKKKNKCYTCNKPLRLVAEFKCKCGSMFCPIHRYPETHACSFDFKKMGREELSEAIPMVKADKLQRI